VRRVTAAGLAITLLLSLSGCGGDAQHPSFLTRVGRSVGLADPAPRPTITLDLVCDPSKDGTCTAGALDASLAAALPVIAERPGSELRLWIIGPDLAATRVVATVKGTVASSGNAATIKTVSARFVDGARSSCMTAAQPALAEPLKGGSPIAESLTAIAMANVQTDLRAILVISDGREVSAIGGDFECDDPLPDPPSFAKALQRERVLPPGSLAGTRVFFTFMIHLSRYIQTLSMIRSVIINLLMYFLKTATIPTYQGISIAFPRYIAMQHSPLHDLIFMPYMFLLHWQRHTLHTS